MYIYLNTQFSDNETIIIKSYCDKYKTELSIMYTVNTNLFNESYIVPTRIISTGGYYLLEEKDDDGKWSICQRYNKKLLLLGKYGSLEKALNSL